MDSNGNGKDLNMEQSSLSTPHDTIRTDIMSLEENTSKSTSVAAMDLYKMRARGKKGNHSPTRIEFQRVNSKKNEKRSKFNLFHKRTVAHRCRKCGSEPKANGLKAAGNSFYDRDIHDTQNDESETPKERIEIYYFDHGNCAYFRTTDCPPTIISEKYAQRVSEAATKFWAEVYGSMHIGVAFLVAFLLQTFRFILYSTVRPILVGILQITTDYLTKPLLAIVFNGVLQPVFILFYNIFTSICDMVEPIAKAIGHFLLPLTQLVSAIRLIDVQFYGTTRKKRSGGGAAAIAEEV